MPYVFKKTVTRYKDAQGKRVKKGTPGAVKVKEKTRYWWGEYKDRDGVPRRVPLCSDKQASKTMLGKLDVDARQGRYDLFDRYADHRKRPLKEHLEDYRRHLQAKENDEAYVRPTLAKILRVFDSCGFTFIGDIKRAAVMDFLCKQRQDGQPVSVPSGQEWFSVSEVAALVGRFTAGAIGRMARRRLVPSEGVGRTRRFHRSAVQALAERSRRGMGTTTSNHHVTAVKGFTRWLVDESRTEADPLAGLKRLNADVDVRRARRPASVGEFGQLLEAASAGRPFRGLSGQDRVCLYLLAAYTGLRAKELGSLCPESFRVDSRPATVTVFAKYSKHKKKDVQKLRDDVVEMMRGLLSRTKAGERLWPGSWWKNAAEMVRIDLEAANIPYQLGVEFFDFHGTRKTFISWLEQSGARIKVAQGLARHSTITLTMDTYAHRDDDAEMNALNRLPAPSLPPVMTAEGQGLSMDWTI